MEEGRSSKTQLLLTRDTLDEFKKMTSAVKEAGLKANGYAPYLIMQANHSGRYSNPDNKPAPMSLTVTRFLSNIAQRMIPAS